MSIYIRRSECGKTLLFAEVDHCIMLNAAIALHRTYENQLLKRWAYISIRLHIYIYAKHLLSHRATSLLIALYATTVFPQSTNVQYVEAIYRRVSVPGVVRIGLQCSPQGESPTEVLPHSCHFDLTRSIVPVRFKVVAYTGRTFAGDQFMVPIDGKCTKMPSDPMYV